jgi:hypothetical protein
MISTKILLINAPNLFDSKINDFHAIKWDTSRVPEATNTRGEVKPSASLSLLLLYFSYCRGLDSPIRSSL